MIKFNDTYFNCGVVNSRRVCNCLKVLNNITERFDF